MKVQGILVATVYLLLCLAGCAGPGQTETTSSGESHSAESTAPLDDADFQQESAGFAPTDQMTEPFTVSTPIQEVMDDPIFGRYGRLLFPVEDWYMSGDTLGELQLTWYNNIRDDLLKLRNVLETIGKIYDFPHLTKLFLKSDFPPERKAEFKSYSDSELKRLNAQIVKMEEQIARAMIIHQMLGTRISDTLTLRKDCLYKHDRQDMIIIYQPKTRRYEKPISRELAQLIGKAVSYANEHYPESIYIFADENKPERPISYQTLQDKVLRMIYEKDIRDDSGNLFGFGTHMFRHCYGVKLTELHVDDWTIAKLLGHKGVRSVQYYRKMSNQRMADETREVRNFMSQIILASLDGWGEEYEQIRQDAGIE